MSPQTVWKILHPYPEVAEGRVTEDSFVVTMGAIWERLELNAKIDVDPRYLDPEGFYRRTHFTDAMKTLLSNIVKRMKCEPAQSVYHLQVGMGGGKSHTLLLLYYLSKHPEKALPFLRREGIAQEAPRFRTAVLDGTRIDITFGKEFPDRTRVKTMWGLLFKVLGVYDDFKEIDKWDESPSVSTLTKALAGKPTLIVIDELTFYLVNVLGNRRLTERMQAFLQALTVAVKDTPGCALVVTTPVGIYEEGQKFVTDVLSRFCTPTIVAAGKEYKSIRRRALYTDDFDKIGSEIEETGREYEKLYQKHLPNRASSAIELIKDNYPFHPFVDHTLQNLKENTAFQQVRDELRFLAGLIYSVHSTKAPDASLINVGHARLEDQYVRGGTISKLKDPILVNRIDTELDERLKQIPEELQPTARKALATIVLNSLTTTRPLEQGVTEEETKYALLNPAANPALISEALKQIQKNLWFVDIVNDRYVFGRPNLNKLIDDYMKKLEKDTALTGLWWNKIQAELEKWRRDATAAYTKQARDKGKPPLFNPSDIHVWIHRSDEIPDNDRSLKLILADYTIAANGTSKTRAADSPEAACEAVKDLYETYGQTPRNLKNTVYFLVASRAEDLENGPVKYAKELMALEEMGKDREELRDLIGEQGIKQIDSLRATALVNLPRSCASAYQYLVYPNQTGLTAIQLGAERMQVENIPALVEDKLRTQAKKIVEQIGADTLLDRYWPKATERIEIGALIDGFYRRPEIEVITNRQVVESAILEAIREGKAAYSYGSEIYFRKQVAPIKDDGFLIKYPEIAEITITAIDDQSQTLPIPIRIDGKEQKATPAQIPDLKGVTHKIRPILPSGMNFSGWNDGHALEEREITWSQNAEYMFTCTIPPAPPVEEADLGIYAVDIKSSSPLNISFSVDDETYQTPNTVKVRKGRRHRLTVQSPKGMAFEGWSDNYTSTYREILCDYDQHLTAKFSPLQPGSETISGTGTVREGIEAINIHITRSAKEAKLTFTARYTDTSKHLGAMMQLYSQPFRIELSAASGQGKPLEALTLNASATSEKQGEIKTCLTQLRDYLEQVEITLHKKEEEYTALNNLISEAALKALEKMEGNLSYRLIVMADASLPPPIRSLQGALDKFKRER